MIFWGFKAGRGDDGSRQVNNISAPPTPRFAQVCNLKDLRKADFVSMKSTGVTKEFRASMQSKGVSEDFRERSRIGLVRVIDMQPGGLYHRQYR